MATSVLALSTSSRSRLSANMNQDWEPVIIRKRPVSSAVANSEQNVNAARRQGAVVDTQKKFGAGGNKPGATTSTGKSASKLDAETEDFRHETVSSTLKTQIVQARTAKKMTQAQLAQAINEKPQIIQEYESGKAIPNPQILSKMSRILGVTLKRTG